MANIVRGIFLGLCLAIVSGISILLIRNGVFKSVKFTIEDRPAFTVVEKAHVGPYNTILETLDEVENWLKANHGDCPETFGQYVDDPNVVEQERLRSNVGCLISAQPTTTLPEGFQSQVYPARKYLVARYSGSPALGPYKVYNKVEAQLREYGLSADGAPIEIYKVLDADKMETTYLFPAK